METGAQTHSEYDVTSGTPPADNAGELHQYWASEIEAFEERRRDFLKRGNKIVRRFTDDRATSEAETKAGGTEFKLNLFYSNVSLLQSMLFGSTPKIDVSREHKDPDDDEARVAAMLFSRILQADASVSGGDLATCLHAALQDRLLPGLGTARVFYEASFKDQKIINPETLDVDDSEKLEQEIARTGYVHWQDFAWGWARTWSEVPWLGYRSYLTSKQATERFGEKKARKLTYNVQTPSGNSKAESDDKKQTAGNVRKAMIWEIWCKSTGKVYWFSPGTSLLLDAQDDPYKLDGFWPSPMPLMANCTTSLMMPVADFVLAQDLYNEVDVLQTRISMITRAMKVVGVYDKAATNSVGRMLTEAAENELIAVDNWALFAEKGGLQGVIDYFPVQEIAGVLTELRKLLGETIELLFQVTGMSDIVRGGSTDQYTSDGTNQLKAKFGSIRVQALQDDFARFASDLTSLRAEVISKHYDEASIFTQSNASYIPKADQELLGPAVQLMKSPDVKWRIEIKPESIAMIDYAQLQNERTSFLTAMATYIQSAQAMVSVAPDSMAVLLEMLKWAMAAFKGSDYLEGMLDKAIDDLSKAQGQPKEDPEAKARQQEMEASQATHQMEMQKIQAKAQADIAVQQEKARASMELERQDHANNMELELTEHRNVIEKAREEFMAEVARIREDLAADIKLELAQSAYAIEEEEVRHDNKMIQMDADHDNKMKERKSDEVETGQGDG